MGLVEIPEQTEFVGSCGRASRSNWSRESNWYQTFIRKSQHPGTSSSEAFHAQELCAPRAGRSRRGTDGCASQSHLHRVHAGALHATAPSQFCTWCHQSSLVQLFPSCPPFCVSLLACTFQDCFSPLSFSLC